MTSTGRRSPARMPAGLAILLFMTALVLPQAHAHADSAFINGSPSARIQALGSHFAWIIPDEMTDLTLNPARAWDVESLTLNYGFRKPGTSSLLFPMVSSFREWDYYFRNSINTNELKLFGASAWGWKWSIETEWKLEHEDDCSQSGNDVFTRNWNGDMRLRMSETCSVNDNNFVRFDIASARKLGEKTLLGLRAGGAYRYFDRKNRRRSTSDEYMYDSDTGEYLPDYSQSDDMMSDGAEKHFSGYLEAGMTWKESGELVLRGGYAQGNALVDNYDLSVETDYDRYTGEMDDYNYRISGWREDLQGDSWLLSARAKKRYHGGFVIVMSGSYERGSFDSDWGNEYMNYSWGGYSDLQIEDQMRFICEGVRSHSEAVFSMGKTYPLERRLDITPGAHVSYKREKFDEDGTSYISSTINEDGAASSLQSEFPVAFETTISQTRVTLPVAIEFRPASFFRLYSGFAINFTWNRTSQKNTYLLEQVGIDDPALPDEIETDGNAFESGYLAKIGFSLRYRDKLILDMYTGSSITPLSIYNYIFDLRYVF